MPPVRWKCRCIALLTLLQTLIVADAQQNVVSMSADGWRPIIGTRSQPSFDSQVKTSDVTQYKYPSQNIEVDVVKADTPVLPLSTVTPPKLPTKISSANNAINNINGATFQKQGGKIPPHAKFTSPGPYHTIPSKLQGQHVAKGTANSRPGQFGQVQKRPPNKPLANQFGANLKRKPVRGLATANSNREEVFVRPPSSASFSSFAQLNNNAKIRESQRLAQPSNGHFSIKPSSQIDFNNGFILPPPTDNFQQFKSNPVTYIFSQSIPQTNEVRFQSDDYTRNLVPPPLAPFQQEKGKLKPAKVTSHVKENTSPVTEPIIKLSEFSTNSQQFGLQPPQFQDNLVPQLAPSFEQSFSFQKPFSKPKEGATDVQVTKEQLKVFHNNVPTRFSSNDYVDFDFHSVKRPQQLPKLQTYEVTEGKWIDSPNPFTFNFANSQAIAPQKLIMLPTASPQLVSEPTVQLNLPPFLPTPYRPEGVVPTSPTQSEASTVFTQVSSKMNRYKNAALTTNPLFFDVKEVSTHYPILGKPAALDSTRIPTLMDTSGELSNEITTLKQQQKIEEIEVAKIPTTKRTKTRRRRPQPRKPTSTTTSTTEEPSIVENFELQKNQENFEAVPMDTERPLRRQRPRPNRPKVSSSSESEERPVHYRTTTPPSENEDNTEKRVRGRHRYRQRGYGTKLDTRSSPARKHIRPSNTEMPPNHKMTETDVATLSDEATEAIMEIHSTEHETQGIFESKYSQESSQSSEEENKRKKTEFELPGRHYEPTQYEDESKYETTVVSSEANSVQKPDHEDSDLVETQRIQEKALSGGSPEQDTMANLPENEIDYSTISPAFVQDNEHIQATLATTLPTTTTTEATTTKSHRIRGRPVKYGSSNRPRFSVKDYRQRLNQYTSTTPSTTTETIKTTSEGIRLRFPSRKLRTRPTPKTTTEVNYDVEEEHTEPIRRGGFKPKEPRHGTVTTEGPYANIITEKNIKSVNTRLRPFARFKSTTETATITPKVFIKPNLFSARRRSPPLNLRMKIFNKFNKNLTEETTIYENEDEITEPITVQTTESEDESVTTETSTESNKMRDMEITTEVNESTTANVSEDDYSQRVSELTSSFRNQYETPGLFKSVSPSSRRIPSYFTLSTEDPILPIEAFFPNLKERDKGQ